MRAVPKKKLTVVVITDDDGLLERAHRQLSDCHLIHRQADSIPKNQEFDFCIIDARTLEPENHHQIYQLGKAQQRIAVDDPKLDNLLARNHVPSGYSLRKPIITCMEMAQVRVIPRGLKQELSDLPYE